VAPFGVCGGSIGGCIGVLGATGCVFVFGATALGCAPIPGAVPGIVGMAMA